MLPNKMFGKLFTEDVATSHEVEKKRLAVEALKGIETPYELGETGIGSCLDYLTTDVPISLS